jgi:beta-phosphoglucomutase-like phosphatase (HAD superfamily)
MASLISKLDHDYVEMLGGLRTAVDERDRAANEFHKDQSKLKALVDADRALMPYLRRLHLDDKKASKILEGGWFGKPEIVKVLEHDNSKEGVLLKNYIVIFQEALRQFRVHVLTLYQAIKRQAQQTEASKVLEVEQKIARELSGLHHLMNTKFRNQFVTLAHHEAPGTREEQYVVNDKPQFWVIVKILSVIEIYLTAVEHEEEFLARHKVNHENAIARLADLHMPVLMFDLDGTIIDTDLDTAGTAKYVETKEILLKHLKKEEFSQKDEEFCITFLRETAGTNAEFATKLYCTMLGDNYGIMLDAAIFGPQRTEERNYTYKARTKFHGHKTGEWFSSIPEAVRKNTWIVTASKAPQVQKLKENPNVLIRGMPFPVFFADRIISGDKYTNPKPHPESYNTALAQFRPVPNRRGIVGIAFEDSEKGIKAARSAGFAGGRLFVVGIASGKSTEQIKSYGVDYITSNLGEIDLMQLCVIAGYEWVNP